MKLTRSRDHTSEGVWSAVKGCNEIWSRRVWAAAEAMAAGVGCIFLVSRATGIDRGTIARGCRELEDLALQANRKILEGADHTDRDAQFRQINEITTSFLETEQPASHQPSPDGLLACQCSLLYSASPCRFQRRDRQRYRSPGYPSSRCNGHSHRASASPRPRGCGRVSQFP